MDSSFLWISRICLLSIGSALRRSARAFVTGFASRPARSPITGFISIWEAADGFAMIADASNLVPKIFAAPVNDSKAQFGSALLELALATIALRKKRVRVILVHGVVFMVV